MYIHTWCLTAAAPCQQTDTRRSVPSQVPIPTSLSSERGGIGMRRLQSSFWPGCYMPPSLLRETSYLEATLLLGYRREKRPQNVYNAPSRPLCYLAFTMKRNSSTYALIPFHMFQGFLYDPARCNAYIYMYSCITCETDQHAAEKAKTTVFLACEVLFLSVYNQSSFCLWVIL